MLHYNCCHHHYARNRPNACAPSIAYAATSFGSKGTARGRKSDEKTKLLLDVSAPVRSDLQSILEHCAAMIHQVEKKPWEYGLIQTHTTVWVATNSCVTEALKKARKSSVSCANMSDSVNNGGVCFVLSLAMASITAPSVSSIVQRHSLAHSLVCLPSKSKLVE